MATVWVLGDQLNRRVGALSTADPLTDSILFVESERMLARPFHRQRAHLVLASMRRFADELRAEGFGVDYRRAPSLAAGLAEHLEEVRPSRVVATEPNGREVAESLGRLGIDLVENDQFLCTRAEFEAWAGDRDRLRMEDFYRWQRTRLGYLMDDGEPAGGRWNFDHDNREPPPRDGGSWPSPLVDALDELDRAVDAEVVGPGAAPAGWWPTSRVGALRRLSHFVEEVLPHFGPHEDAMLAGNWHLAHSMLSPALNLGLLLPGEVCDAVEEAYRSGRVPINSAEGFIRQVIGWREFVRGVYWLWPGQWDANGFGAEHPIPPAWVGEASTDLACLASALEGVEERAWLHHIQRLMILANLATLIGIDPRELRGWMRERFVDAANWVMGPNVMGMGTFADSGLMSTKPYVSGGAYVHRMSDYCRGCRFDPKQRVGDSACPFTTLYWDFLARHREALRSNHRMARQIASLDRLSDLPAVRRRADAVVAAMLAGDL
ncbi:MAG: cryptochrome/photolyase family protein [Acidimicrobiia bacterium]|jgi:deoxyribodipyrimidine photolyase-related protein|nr:MAG: cryptochrome/photolyase family protein [Acidimicrobiia bacterium]